MSLALSPLQHAMLAEMGLKLWRMADKGAQPAVMPPPLTPSQRSPSIFSPSSSSPSLRTQAPQPAQLPRSPESPKQSPALAGLNTAPPISQGLANPPNLPTSTASLTTVATADAARNLDWAALQAAVSGCTACGLCQTRKNTVFGSGPADGVDAPTVQLMVVGEAPGAQEDAQGQPFVGAAGQLLTHMLAALGLTREQVFITNVLKCRPPANRNPLPEEIAQCTPYLQRQIALLNPALILALGRYAAQSLLVGNPMTQAPLGQLRGTLHHYVHGGAEIPLLVSYHPAYLLRSPAEKAKAWQDLCLVGQALKGV